MNLLSNSQNHLNGIIIHHDGVAENQNIDIIKNIS